MKQYTHVLSINGSDNTGGSGIQSDIRTITALGGDALTAVTSVTVRGREGLQSILDLPPDIIIGQVRSIMDGHHVKAVKVGMVRSADAVRALRADVIRCRNLVVVPGILGTDGSRLMSDLTIDALMHSLVPEARLLMLRCNEAELLTGIRISTDDGMLEAARRFTDMGAQAVLLRGGHQVEGRLTALLCTERTTRFFSTRNTEGWQQHGVGGAMSAAIATCLAHGDDIETAIHNAHEYMHSQVVYSITSDRHNWRAEDIYNRYMSLITQHYREAHDVNFYTDRLCVSRRYLSKVCKEVVGRTAKSIIDSYLIKETQQMLATSRLTVGEISSTLGFSSVQMFCKFFRDREHCTPAEYRKRTAQL